MNESLIHTWKPRKLSELGFVGRGKSKHRPRNEPSLYGGPYPFFQTGDVKNAEFYLSHYTQTYSEKGLKQSKLWKAGTLCITIAANIAETAILKIDACFPDSIVGFVPDKSQADVRFIKYYIDTIKLRMQNISQGTTQGNLSLDKLLSFDILTPPLPIQRKIASILSAYDDLIENNTRRIAILEEMARTLYQEWFVKFRFSGYKQVQMVESKLGKVPEEWAIKPFSDLVHVLSGGTPKTSVSEYWHGDIPFFTPKDAPDSFYVLNTEKYITEAGLYTCSSQLYPKETIFITARGTVGKLALNPVEMAMNQSCYALIGKDNLSQTFLFLHTEHFLAYLKQIANGAVFETLIVDTFKSVQVIKPPSPLIDKFRSTIEPTFRQILRLLQKNANLRRTRDLLLTKLISCEIDVSSWVNDEEKEQEAVVASEVRGVREMEPPQPIDVAAMQQSILWE